MKKLKEKKGITLFVLIMMLLVLTIIATVTMSYTNYHKSVIEDKKQIENKFEQDKSSAINEANKYRNMYQ